MKNSIYVIAVIALSFFSCSVDNIDAEVTNELSLAEQVRNIPMNKNTCERFKLISRGVGIGVVEVAFINNNVEITYKTVDDFYLLGTHLSILDQEDEDFPTYSSGNPSPENFEYSKYPSSISKEITIVAPQEYYLENYDFAAYAIVVDQYNLKQEAWSGGQYFNPSTDATYSSINTRNCVY